MYHEPSHKAIDTSLELKYLLYRLYDLKSNPGMNCLQNWSLRDKKVDPRYESVTNFCFEEE